MSTRIELAKQLIDKAKELNDDKLLEMALSLLNEETPVKKIEETKLPKKKPGRKKKVKVEEVVPEKPKVDTSAFIAPVRPEGTHAKGKKIIKDGKEYTISRREPIKLQQKFHDDGRTDKKDKANEILKKYTVRTPRERESASYKTLTCTKCGREENVPSILNFSKSGDEEAKLKFLCVECTGRKMKENAN